MVITGEELAGLYKITLVQISFRILDLLTCRWLPNRQKPTPRRPLKRIFERPGRLFLRFANLDSIFVIVYRL